MRVFRKGAPMTKPLSLELMQGVALITLDAPDASVNILNTPTMQELDATIGKIEKLPDLTAVVLRSGKSSGFVAGADLSEIEGVQNPTVGAKLARNGQRILSRLEQLSVPVVCAINGHCMGGGTELALACHYRIAAEDLSVALPETRLGILPGFGGTQRLPRLVPLRIALDMILSGRPLRADKALSAGLVDRVVGADKLQDAALDMARMAAANPQELLTNRKRSSGGLLNRLLKSWPLSGLIFAAARKQVVKSTGGHYPAPLKAIEVIRSTLGRPLAKGLEIEAQALGELIVTPESKNLIHVFHLSQRHRKQVRAAHVVLPKQGAVLGAGVMGSAIAQLMAEKGMEVILRDLRDDIVTKGLEQVRGSLVEKYLRQGRGAEAVDKTMRKITGTTELSAFREVDLVIEAVVENLKIKQVVLKEVEAALKPSAVIATNTSALSVSSMQQATQRPAQVGGLHFFNPVARMPLVEVIRGEQTSAATLDALLAVADKLGKTPIVVADRPGFLVNRLLMVYLNEAGLLAEEGYAWRALDALVKGFGLPMGPFRLIDEVGIDVAAEVGTTLCTAFSYLPESSLMRRAADQGLLGKKGGMGFYRYGKPGTTAANPGVDQALALSGEKQPGPAQLQRMLYLMVNEAARCLEEGVVKSAFDIDTGMVFGIGFPPFKGGLCRWADQEGHERITATLDGLAGEFGERFTPQGGLVRKEPFYS